MFDRFTDRAREVMGLARQEAQVFNHDYIGTEHILLGLVQEGSGVAASVLKNLDVDPKRIRTEVVKLVSTGETWSPTGQLPFTPRAKKVLELSLEEASNLGHTYIGTEHLLLGLVRENEGIAAQVLRNLRVKLQDVREEVLELLGSGPESGDSPEHDAPPVRAPHAAAEAVALVDVTLDGMSREVRAALSAGDKEKARRLHEKARLLRSIREKLIPRGRLLDLVGDARQTTRAYLANLDRVLESMTAMEEYLIDEVRSKSALEFAPLEALVVLLREKPSSLARILADVKVSEADFLAALERELERHPNGDSNEGHEEPPNGG